MRIGCEMERERNELKFSKGIYDYGYNGEDFLSFDIKETQWVAPVVAALPTKRKWDNVPILNQYTKGYLEKECVDWLNKYREYGDKDLRNVSPPKVHVFAKKSTNDKTRLKLTCRANDFYTKDAVLKIRKYRTSLPEDDTESTGIRPNHDGSFQMIESVEIKEDEEAVYDCWVSHSTLKEPIIIKWDGTCQDCPSKAVTGLITTGIVLLLLALAALVVYILVKKYIIGHSATHYSEEDNEYGRDTGMEMFNEEHLCPRCKNELAAARYEPRGRYIR